MPICDGPRCNREIAWRITSSALQFPGGNVPFSVDEVHGNLLKVLASAKCWNLTPTKRPVVFKNLCKTCWDQQGAAWGDAATYTLARARTTSEGIFMQVTSEAFLESRAPSKEAILSCVIHEMMHYWSFAGSGLQDYNRRANVDWDEAVADILGFRVYSKTYTGKTGFANYVTPYNNYCLGCSKAGDNLAFGPLKNNAERRGKIPQTVAALFDPPPAVQSKVVAGFEKFLTECLLTWFFLGPQTPVSDGKSSVTANRFLESTYLGNMFAPSRAFGLYDGNNKKHLIT